MDAFRRNESLTHGYGKSADELIALFYGHDNSKRDCLGCRRRTAEVFIDLPVSKTKKQNIGTLLSHF
jgi:hypothetical protein